MAIKRVKYKGRDITCPHGNILAEIDGKVCWVSPAEMKRQTGAGKPPRKPSQEDDQGDENQDEGEDQGDDQDPAQGSFWGGK